MTGFEATRRKDGDSEKDSWLEESEAGRLVRARTSSGLSNEQLSIAVRLEVEEAGERELGTNSAAPTPRPPKGIRVEVPP
jgi:hypothetical protein